MKRLLKRLLLTILVFLLVKCSSSMAIDDFFGIKMPLEELEYFKIVAYTESSGISYQSSPNMNPNILAWAGLEGDELRIKLINNTDSAIPLNYDSDQFVIVTKGDKEFICTKGSIITYNNLLEISPFGSVELLLDVPQNYWATVGMKNYQSSNENYVQDIWKGQNTLVFDKADIKYIRINLGFTTNILLKLVPKVEF
ncbi:MAG: hypothetical protein KKF62_18835 [Bacteroidetes bacterium]|nr:hypothetical protein [Bacteroidota bacterium]MBU1116878.1 hypothetical protein [Bacteroidota bacterium]MBU1797444.1 hypothetical protein [Bacteroidota bacterium]